MLCLGFAWLAGAAFAASLGYFLYAYFVLFAVPFEPASPSSGTAPALVNLALFTAFAMHHSLFARTRLKGVVRRYVPPALERAVYTLIASLLFVLVCWWWRPVPGAVWSLSGPWRILGLAAQGAGIVLTLVGGRALDILDLAGIRQVLTAGPRTAPLKTDGLYGFVRHPLYFAWMLLVFGAPDMTGTRFAFAVISTVYLALAIPLEERSLIETFGPAYASYQGKVRWRMVPWLY
ncbi:MAG: isoprenylcysteine carboxylmethyltransferase family protein [Acidobacteria bacterium]|nr:isoprenylcysteine carboxylmethyltransferase family protein [Acidobacteriota bacterium]